LLEKKDLEIYEHLLSNKKMIFTQHNLRNIYITHS